MINILNQYFSFEMNDFFYIIEKIKKQYKDNTYKERKDCDITILKTIEDFLLQGYDSDYCLELIGDQNAFASNIDTFINTVSNINDTRYKQSDSPWYLKRFIDIYYIFDGVDRADLWLCVTD